MQGITPLQYLVTESGQRTGVVLSWLDYQKLTDPDLLVGLSSIELQLLAQGMLSLAHQAQLEQLLQLNQQHQLSNNQEQELDQLLEYIDSLNVLKARALYTLQKTGQTIAL